MPNEWFGTRAGQSASAFFVVREDDGMPFISFDQGDLPPSVTARCMSACLNMLVATEAARSAREEAPTSEQMD